MLEFDSLHGCQVDLEVISNTRCDFGEKNLNLEGKKRNE